MGYYVNLLSSDVRIERSDFEPAYAELCALNAHDEEKTGGSFGGTPAVKPADSTSVASHPDKWFSWMDWNYDETCSTLPQILEMLGFTLSYEDEDEANGAIIGLSYDSKSGAEGIFFSALAPFVHNDARMVWQGEEDEVFVWRFKDGKMEESSI